MFYIKPETTDGFFVPTVHYIKVSPTSGCNIQATKEEAQGVVVNGVPYSIDVDNPIPDTEAATYAFITEWDDEIKAKYDAILCAETATKRIAQSKVDLAAYLESHPLQWTDGEYYSITAEKQTQLTSKIMAATMAQTMSQPYTLTWNSTGEICKEWELDELSALAFAIDARVTALVSYQQTQEVAMRNAQTMDELNAIVVDYDSVEATS